MTQYHLTLLHLYICEKTDIKSNYAWLQKGGGKKTTLFSKPSVYRFSDSDV